MGGLWGRWRPLQARGGVPGPVGDGVRAGGGGGRRAAWGDGAPAADRRGSGIAPVRRAATVRQVPTTPQLTLESLATPPRVVLLAGLERAETTCTALPQKRPAVLAVLVQC